MDHIFSKSWLGVIGLGLCLLFIAGPAAAQNTKGDRPAQGNQRQVRETRQKSVKRKPQKKTKDIAGRRLRTKGSSSANRANANIHQPSTYTRRPQGGGERAAAPRGRTFSRSPKGSTRPAWKGDVSGYRLRRMKPQGLDAARHNVYPQKGPYVRYTRKQPKARPPVYSKTIKGRPFPKHKPKGERAWTGGLQHGPVRNQSATGSVRNTYSQKGPYVAHYNKHAKKGTTSYNNRREVSKVKRYSRPAVTGGSQPRYYPSSRSRPYVQRGRKNVYWGKYQKKEKGVTTDLTGGPVRTRNYKSPAAGLVGRDTLQFFGRKPSGDRAPRASASGYPTATRKGSRGWKGDVAGWPVRSPRKPVDRTQKPLKPTEPGIGGMWLKSIFNKNFKGVKPKHLVPDTREARYQGTIPRQDATKSFDSQGIGYSGNMKRGRTQKSGIGYSGKMRRGSGPGFDRSSVGYSGNIRRQGGKTFSGEYIGYSGNIKRGRKQFNGDYVGYSGTIKRGRKQFNGDYIGFSGRDKRGEKGFSSEYIGYSGNIKRRKKEFSGDYVGYSGTLKRGERGFSSEYIGYSGNLKRRKPNYSRDGAGYRGDIPHVGPIKQFEPGGVGYSGFMKRGEKGYEYQGEGFSGKIRSKRPAKGGGSVSGVLWNNNESALAKNPPLVGGINYSGRMKAKRPAKGGGSVSGVLWNNNESALAKNPPMVGGINYSGRIKAKRPDKGGGTVSGVLWNNNESALAKDIPSGAGDIRSSKVRVKAKDVRHNKNSKRGALPGVAPTKASVKAGEYSRAMKLQWNYKRNPNSAAAARKTIAPGKAEGRIGDYQGNVKMRKHSMRGMHPDSKFAHLEEDNVKEERGLLTNVKLFWQKIFHKNGTQPSSVKEKPKKLQYDKREKGLWAY